MTAAYVGSFNPFTLGHLDIALRAARLFDRLIIGVAADTDKNTVQVETRTALAKKSLQGRADNITVLSYSGLTTDFIKQHDCRIIVRGIRSAIDNDYEHNLSRIYAGLGDYETVTLFSNCPHISSSVVRSLARLNVDLSGYLPCEIADEVKKIYTP